MLNPLNWLFGLNKLLVKIETFFLGLTLIALLFFAFLQVVLRNFFDSGINWGDVFARHLVLWIAFFGATLSTREGRHISIDALAKILPDRAKPIVDLFIRFFCIVVCFLLAKAAYKFMLDEKMAATILFAKVPTWYFITIMPIGFTIITYAYFVQFIEVLWKFGGKEKAVARAKGHQELDISVKIKLK
ncbi:MAG: TRAP transporter small permease [Deltaproteobacteria bacterium]|nr:TRAP transporter small permease [Deltaproteobacteria bacterium]MBI4412599.1 TRAP transporter small permease [Deltaproteobacteria bacterium]